MMVLAGNTWDKDDNSGVFCLGCGPQEEFYNCADIKIVPDKAMKSKAQRKNKLNGALVERQDETLKKELKSSKKLVKNTIIATKIGKAKPASIYNEVEMKEESVQTKSGAGEKEKSVQTKSGTAMRGKTVQSQSRVEVKGGAGGGQKKPREDSYSWHAASPLSWARAPRRPVPPPPTATAAAATTTKRKNPFTRPLTPARKRTTTATLRKSLTRPVTTPRPRRRNSETKRLTQPRKTPKTVTTPAAGRATVQRSRTAADERRVSGMPSWLVRMTGKLKQRHEDVETAAAQRVRPQAYSMESIEARRKLFRLKLWRHLQHSKQRQRNVTSASATHR